LRAEGWCRCRQQPLPGRWKGGWRQALGLPSGRQWPLLQRRGSATSGEAAQKSARGRNWLSGQSSVNLRSLPRWRVIAAVENAAEVSCLGLKGGNEFRKAAAFEAFADRGKRKRGEHAALAVSYGNPNRHHRLDDAAFVEGVAIGLCGCDHLRKLRRTECGELAPRRLAGGKHAGNVVFRLEGQEREGACADTQRAAVADVQRQRADREGASAAVNAERIVAIAHGQVDRVAGRGGEAGKRRAGKVDDVIAAR